MKVSVVLNCAAGTLARDTPEAGAAAVAEAFAAAGLEPEVVCADGSGIERAVREASRRSDIVIVGGGDGTLRAAASLLMGSPAAMGVLPLGTFNHFAKELGVPLDLPAAAVALARGRPEKMDIATVNGRVFINHAAVGIYPHMVRRRETLRKQQPIGKFPAMAVALLDTIMKYRTFGLRVRIGDAATVRRSPFAFIFLTITNS